jgi:CelD/BcsL family acetyltransferase involved in cellulose biosynthesis
MWLVDRGSVEEQEKLVLACAAAGTATTMQTRCAFRRAGGTRLARWIGGSNHDSAALYMSARCATEVRGSKHTVVRLWVMCKRKRSWTLIIARCLQRSGQVANTLLCGVCQR